MDHRTVGSTYLSVFGLGDSYELTEKICAFLNIRPSAVSISVFPSGETLAEPVESVRGKYVFIVQSISAHFSDNLLELLIFIDALHRAAAREIVVLIPCLSFFDQRRGSTTSDFVASALTMAGATRVMTVDLIDPQIQGFYSCPFDELTILPSLAKSINGIISSQNNLVIVAPRHEDSGPCRKLSGYLGCPNTAIMYENDNHELSIIGQVVDRDCLIYTNTINTGDIVFDAIEELRRAGAKRIYVSCVHGMFTDQAIKRINALNLDKLFTTDTVPGICSQFAKRNDVIIVPCAPTVAGGIFNVGEDKSVSGLFGP